MLHRCIDSKLRYAIDRSAPLASGGTSKLYKCQDTIGIRGVCKIMPKSESMRRKFLNEVACLHSLSFSPKVVQLYDSMETDDEYALIMEWCRGGAVRDFTGRYGDIYSENTVASIMRGVMRGLVHVHGVGIVHADIKPGNVLFTDTSDNAEVKLADFGSAMRLDQVSDSLTFISGTPWYMSPEALRSVVYPTSDVWGAGVMAYQLLTGRMPFDDVMALPRVNVIWQKILNAEPSWSGSQWEAVSAEAKDFVMRCLAKDSQDRPSAMECLAHSWLEQTNCEDRFTGVPLVMPEGCTIPSMSARTWEVKNHLS